MATSGQQDRAKIETEMAGQPNYTSRATIPEVLRRVQNKGRPMDRAWCPPSCTDAQPGAAAGTTRKEEDIRRTALLGRSGGPREEDKPGGQHRGG